MIILPELPRADQSANYFPYFPDRNMNTSYMMAAALATVVPFADAQPPSFASLDSSIDRAIEERRIVGAVVLVAHKREIVFHRAAGYADREQGRPMHEDDIFRLSSVTKPMVSAAALRLVERGLLDLRAPVAQWLPQFQPHLPDGSTTPITIHQLLTHTAGLSYGFMEPADGPYHRAGVSDGLDASVTLAENLHRIASVPLAYAPGTGWRYSVALDVLGAAMSASTGSSLPDLIQREITCPLGMRDTGFCVVDEARLVTPYQDGKPAPARMPAIAEVSFAAASIRFRPDSLGSTDGIPPVAQAWSVRHRISCVSC